VHVEPGFQRRQLRQVPQRRQGHKEALLSKAQAAAAAAAAAAQEPAQAPGSSVRAGQGALEPGRTIPKKAPQPTRKGSLLLRRGGRLKLERLESCVLHAERQTKELRRAKFLRSPGCWRLQ